MWPIISELGAGLRRFVESGYPGDTVWRGIKFSIDQLVRAAAGGEVETVPEVTESVRAWTTIELWRQLALLPTIYEEVCREWFLPTPLGLQLVGLNGTLL